MSQRKRQRQLDNGGTPATLGLVAVCVVVHLIGQSVPVVTTSIGAVYPYAVIALGLWPDHLAPWQFFTYVFVHTDWLHVLVNCALLLGFGSFVESRRGSRAVLAVFALGSGVSAGAHLLALWSFHGAIHVPLVGCSGAVATLIGITWIPGLPGRRSRVRRAPTWAAALLIGLIIGVMWAVMDRGSRVSHWAHVGGFGLGMLLSWVWVVGRVGAGEGRAAHRIAAAEAQLRRSPNDPYLLWRLARALSVAHEPRAAVDAYRRAIWRFAEEQQYAEIVECYIELAECDERALPGLEFLITVTRRLEHGDLQRAIGLYKRMAARGDSRPEGEYALLRLATLYGVRMNEAHSGLACLDEFHERYPDSQWTANAEQLRVAIG